MANFDQKNLKALKKQLIEQKKQEKLATEEKQREQIIQKQDEHVFRNAMSGVKPLVNNDVVHELKKTKAKRIRQDNFDSEDVTFEELIINDYLSDELEVTEVDGEEILSFCRSGIQNNVFKKLRSGSYRISDELDLHGASIKQAKQILVYYLQEAVQFESCCIRIIHGKGQRSNGLKPVLKTQVNHWLQEHERVLAFHSAKAKDGGAGALYVLLKR